MFCPLTKKRIVTKKFFCFSSSFFMLVFVYLFFCSTLHLFCFQNEGVNCFKKDEGRTIKEHIVCHNLFLKNKDLKNKDLCFNSCCQCSLLCVFCVVICIFLLLFFVNVFSFKNNALYKQNCTNKAS